MGPKTARARMLDAYTGQANERPPVAPEFWYYLPARVLGISMIELELEVPHWQALQQTFSHYQSEGWGIAAPGLPQGWGGKETCRTDWTADGQLEMTVELRVGGLDLRRRQIYDPREPSWAVERLVKDFERDWPAYAQMALFPPGQLDWGPVQNALDGVGEDYLLEVYVGDGFVDFAGGQREGGLEQVIMDLADRPEEMSALQQRYIAYLSAKITEALTRTTAKSVFIGSIWASLSLLSPRLWRKWDRPVLEAAVEAAHAAGGLVHYHFHGKSRGVLKDLAEIGLDCICPFERPPGGDIRDLSEVARALAGRTAFNGNVHTVETLIRGTPRDVEREVLEILAAFADSPRLIVGTGDQVGWETPDENIWAMVETVKRGG
jgi:hypothetical protein